MFSKCARVFSLLAVLLLCLYPVAAQTGATAQKKSGSSAAAKPQTVTVSGCLQKGDEANEFMLTTADNKRYELRSRTVALAKHVGHKVSVTGTPMGGETEERGEHKKGAAAEPAHEHLRVTNLEMISASCK